MSANTSIPWATLQVIVGAESGPDRLPFDPQWARDMLEVCRRHDVTFYYKQSSGHRPDADPYLDGEMIRQIPEVTYRPRGTQATIA